jgi:hypothetical protein
MHVRDKLDQVARVEGLTEVRYGQPVSDVGGFVAEFNRLQQWPTAFQIRWFRLLIYVSIRGAGGHLIF